MLCQLYIAKILVIKYPLLFITDYSTNDYPFSILRVTSMLQLVVPDLVDCSIMMIWHGDHRITMFLTVAF